MQQDDATSIFEERAENLPRTSLEQWTKLSDRETLAVAKLRGTGAKLLIGPRGSGKSTLMRVAYYELLDGQDTLPVYVNYAQHLALEPMFHSRSDATELFRQWVLGKVVVGTVESLDELGAEHPDDQVIASSQILVDELQTGQAPSDVEYMSPSRLTAFLNRVAKSVGRKRVVLLFDDAAHAFSARQQREFFEIFRQMKSRTIAPKAAVYPGVTSYSANMHIGHDAEMVEAWYRSDDPSFLDTMQDVLSRRLPSELLEEFTGDRHDFLRYLALASFGLPRSFLAMIQEVLEYDEDTGKHSTPTRRSAEKAVERNVDNLRQLFASTGTKIPRYSNLIAEGQRLEQSVIAALRRMNADRPVESKTITVGFRQPLASQFLQVLNLMAYAGVLRKIETQSRGSAGMFDRYEMHAGFVIAANALSLGRSPSTRDIVTALTSRSTSTLVRGRTETFLGPDYLSRCTLNLTPCLACGAPRASEDAQFCMRCGKPLTEKSLYKEILQRPVGDLPIPPKKKAALVKTQLKTIEDILLDVQFTELIKGRYIGPVWAKRIHSAAEEYVSV